MEVSKSDWKLFRTHIAEWQESYMERLVKEYIELLGSADNASDKFWKLEERIKKDKKHPGVIFELSKGNMIFDIVALINCGVITTADLKLKQVTGAKNKLANQMDNLCVSDKYYDKKYEDMQVRLDKLYDEIEEIETSIEEVETRLYNIKQEKISGFFGRKVIDNEFERFE